MSPGHARTAPSSSRSWNPGYWNGYWPIRQPRTPGKNQPPAHAAALGTLNTTPRGNSMTIQAINVRNQFKGQIREIIRGDVLSESDVQTAAGIVTSVITTRSVDELALQVGSEVIAFVKSTEVSIAKL